MNSLLLWIGGLLVAVLCALFAVPHFVDWNRFRGVFEEEASRALGREIRVDGNVNVQLLPAPFVRFERLAVADADGVVGEPVFRADSFTLWLSIAPLLRGVVEAREIVLQKPVLKLKLAPNGGGNWQTFRLSLGTLPYMPGEVALQSIKIAGGAISVRAADDHDVLAADAINGEVSAGGLDGSFKFRLDLGLAGEAREVRGSTGSPDADGNVRLKASVRAPKSGSSYVIDGRVLEPGGRTRFEGELTAKLPLGIGAAPTGAAGGEDRAVFDLRANLAADTTQAKLTDVALSFEQDGRPQLITGDASVGWIGGTTLDATLASRWLDLDRISRGASPDGPLDATRQLLAEGFDLLPSEGHIRASLQIDQANIGGDVASNVRLALNRGSGGAIEIKELAAALPGGARLDIAGRVAGKGRSSLFNGTVALRGQSFVRFAGWAIKSFAGVEARRDGPFQLRSQLELGPTSLKLIDAAAEFAATAVNGGLSYQWDKDRVLAVDVNGAQIDVSALDPGLLEPGALKRLLWPDADGKPAAGGVAGWLDRPNADVALKLAAERLSDGTRELTDVAADLRLKGGEVTIGKLRFASPAGGLQVEVEGRITRDPAQRKGELRGMLTAADGSAIGELADLLALDRERFSERGAVAAMMPLRLAWSASVGRRTAKALDLRTDGMVRGSRAVLDLRLDGGSRDWERAPIAATLIVDGSNLSELASLLLPASEIRATRREEAGKPARLEVQAGGQTAGDLITLASVEAAASRLDFDGRIGVSNDGIARIGGEIKVAVPDLGRLIGAANLSRTPAVGPVALNGSAQLTVGDGKARIATRALKVGSQSVSGVVDWPSAGGAFDARLTTARIELASLLSGVLDGRAVVAEGQASGDGTQRASLWPEAPFDFAPLARLSGSLRLEAGQLVVGPDVDLSDAVAELQLSPDAIQMTRISGKALGGTATVTGKLAKAPAGADLAGELRFADAQPGGEGQIGLQLTVGGRGLTPRALVGALSGSGEARIEGVRVPRLSAAAAVTVAEAVLAGKAEASGDGLRQALAQSLASGSLALGNRKVAIDVADGVAKVRAFQIEAGANRVSNQTTVDLSSLRFDSEWRIGAVPAGKSPAGGKPPLPDIVVVHVGALGAIASTEPRISAEAFEREIAVRKMEHDVEQLERLRKQDEERSKVEAERRAQIERDRLAAERASLEAEQARQGMRPAAGPAGATGTTDIVPPGTSEGTPAPQSWPAAAINAAPTEPGRAPDGQKAADPQRSQATQPAPEARRRPAPSSSGNWTPTQRMLSDYERQLRSP